MTTFLQLHLLTSYPPACLNRDDLNRPKTALMGGVPRLRISSQSLKRSWRVSSIFKETVSGQTGIRSKEIARLIRDSLLSGIYLVELVKPNSPKIDADGKVLESDAKEWAWIIACEYVNKKSSGTDEEAEPTEEKESKSKKKTAKSNVSKETLKSEQVVFYSKSEIEAIDLLIIELRKSGKPPTADHLKRIKVKEAKGTADLALFGRMLASSPDHNVEAACQVSHAITVHRAAVEDDFFTAVDDLNRHEEDAGSAHMGEQGFGAGLFYTYVCIDCDLLIANLGGDDGAIELAEKTIKALIEAAAKVAPTGKQNSFASRAQAYYVLAEKGPRQPRSLSLAFVKPVDDKGEGMAANAINALEKLRDNMDKVYYGEITSPSRFIDALKGEGSFAELLEWAAACKGA